MSFSFGSWPIALSLTLGAAAIGGCGAKHYWHADAVTEAPTVVVQTTQVYTSGSRLYVRAAVTNRGSLPILVNRDAIRAVLPSGAAVGRSTGMTSLHAPYIINAGQAHAVYVDFMAEGFEWDTVSGVQIAWGPAITSEGRAVDVPLMAIRP